MKPGFARLEAEMAASEHYLSKQCNLDPNLFSKRGCSERADFFFGRGSRT